MAFHQSAGHQSNRWELIQNGFDLDTFRPDEAVRREVRRELSFNDDDVIIGMLARYDTFKDHRTFIEAAALLHATHPHVQFLLAGRGVSDGNGEVCSQLDRLGLRRHVRLLGEYGRPARLLAALDIGTLCSITEGFPNALGEAMSAALPCVATDVGDCRTLLGETGFTVPVRDERALASRWRELVDRSATDRRHLGLAARNRISEHYSMNRIARVYEQLYSSISGRS
jgi:glycosyltransferase involved in cell wall biosynthesis